MEITEKLLLELQNRLKVGSRRGVHLNAIPARSRYKFDLTRLSHIDENLPQNFINALLSEQHLKFKVSWKDNVPDLNSLFEDDQVQLVKITKSFENLINQTDAIESEKGINTFGFGFPLLVRRDQSDKKLTVAPILIWSLKIKRTKEFNTWVIIRDEDDPIYINEVLINHLQSDSQIEINPISPELLDDGLIDKEELIDICVDLIESINSTSPNDLRDTFKQKIENIKSISDKKHYEKLPLTSNNSFIDFGGLFSIFEVQKQNIIHDYVNLLNLEGTTIDLEDMDEHSFQPISSVETDPSQQSILHSLKNTRNILIQGPPGTGKSQSLTAILINALENHKKTIVVCEKITALNVLKEALDKKGLSNLNVQITEVQKSGRRNVVCSVRDRIENTQYRRYRYTHSKETLDNIIDKAKSLIDSINKKHLKLGEKLIGNKNWTHIVGSLLSELKDNTEEYNLDLKKETFSFESTELNGLLELIRKGQNLYNNYKPFRELSFLNSSKLVGDNPFIIEQHIQFDYSFYEKEYSQIKQKTKDFHEEYFNIRKNEIADKIEEYGRLTTEFKNTYNAFPQLIKNFKVEFTETRNIELQNELIKIQNKVDEIRSVFEMYSSNALFLDDEKVNSFGFKIKSLFSKNLVKLKKSRELVTNRIQEIETTLYKCKDLPKNEFGKTVIENKKAFYLYLETLEKVKAEISNKINNEFIELNLESFLNDNIDSQNCFQQLNNVSTTRSNNFKTLISSIFSQLREIQSMLINNRNSISSFIDSSKDLPSISFTNAFYTTSINLDDYHSYLEKSHSEFIEVINNEIINLDILKPIDSKYKTRNFDDVNKSYQDLSDKINQDGCEKV